MRRFVHCTMCCRSNCQLNRLLGTPTAHMMADCTAACESTPCSSPSHTKSLQPSSNFSRFPEVPAETKYSLGARQADQIATRASALEQHLAALAMLHGLIHCICCLLEREHLPGRHLDNAVHEHLHAHVVVTTSSQMVTQHKWSLKLQLLERYFGIDASDSWQTFTHLHQLLSLLLPGACRFLLRQPPQDGKACATRRAGCMACSPH